jgi:hypothetical protein
VNEQTKAAIDGAFDAADEAFAKADEAFKAVRNDPTIQRTYSCTIDQKTATSEDKTIRFQSRDWRERLKNFRKFGGMALASLFTGTTTLTFSKK